MLVNLSSFFLSAVTVFAMQLISSHLDKDLSHLKSRRLLKEGIYIPNDVGPQVIHAALNFHVSLLLFCLFVLWDFMVLLSWSSYGSYCVYP